MSVHSAPSLAFLVDGHMTMLEMCICFLCAERTIYITAFGLTPELLLVRGEYKCAGSTGSPEQEKLISWLREKGLSEEALRFWQDCDELSVANVLKYVVNKGVKVKILLWDTYTMPFQVGPKDIQQVLEALGVCCALDDSHKGLLNHPLEAHHQKSAIVDSRLAFVGGIDVMMDNDGDFDRWDTSAHPYHTPLRLGKDGKMPHSWHDVHVLFEGPAVADVERNFRQRWNAVVTLHQADSPLILAEPAAARLNTPQLAHTDDTVRLQVVRTIPKGGYPFTEEDGIATILETYQRIFAQAKRSIYIENQYFWIRTFLGFENPALGVPHPDMEGLLHALAEALARGVIVTFVLPDNPNVGREFTDEGLNALWELAPQAVTSGRLRAYTLGSSMQQQESTAYRSIYVHAKTTIVDDTWITLGSANLNNRGMRDDTELNVAILHPELARRLRILLMAEHLCLCDEEMLFQMLNTLGKVHTPTSLENASFLQRWTRSWLRPKRVARAATGELLASAQLNSELGACWAALTSQLSDPASAAALFAKQASENLLAVKARQPLTGHLLPYIPHTQAQMYEVEIHAVNGWLDTLPDPQRDAESATTP